MARPTHYTAVAMILHWVMALGIAALVAMGFVMTQAKLAPAPLFELYQLHKSVGITILLAAVVRLVWRMTHRPPPLPTDMRGPEVAAAHGAHALLYLMMFGLPLTGWALVSASPLNIPTVLYGLVPWPHLRMFTQMADRAGMANILGGMHAWGAWIFVGIVTGHIGAAFRHHILIGDDVLHRMLPLPPQRPR